ncbi:neprilysin-1-like [Physella acuta]|uniref:neprilysin-1-like n=1 Tax=Physella acuta TaxID=109671 RepID=UPI0027DCD73F|nr:neprilysin-1-like [Physella acuta]
MEESKNAFQKKDEIKDICLTAGCINAASRLIVSMDTSVHPCDDFFEFSCGNWNRLNTIPNDRAIYNTFTKLGDDIQTILKSLLEQEIQPELDSEATKKVKIVYNSCLNETLIDKEGLRPINQLFEEFGGWPILEGDAWESKTETLSLLVNQFNYNTKALVDHLVGADDKNPELNIIQLDQPELGMPSPDYFLYDDANSKLLVYKRFALQMAEALGAEAQTAKRDVDAMIDFEIQLAKITKPKAQRRDNEAMYKNMTIQDFALKVPEIEWLKYLQEIYKTADIVITEHETIVVYALPYFVALGKLIQRSPTRVLANYVIWRCLMARIDNLPKEYRKIRSEFSKHIFGSESEPPRWYDCVSYINDNMGNAAGRLFVERHFDEGSKETAMEMIDDIREAFYQLLDEADWMDDTTRVVAKEKAQAVSVNIGYPESILNNTALDAEYDGLIFHPDRFFDNVVKLLKHKAFSTVKKLRQPVDKSKWSTTPANVNAYYSSIRNQITFPAAILQQPFYSKDYPKSLNYGGIGMVIGHEMTHGFDDRGRQYDKNGILVQWWDDEVIRRFKERAQCIIDQYNNYSVPEVKMNVNGIQTQGENIADNGGLKEAYKAFRNSRGHLEQRLPGLLEYSNDQLFFINFAQVWCGVMRPEATVTRLKTGVHSPGRFRVIGTLQNMEAFSEAFNCSVGSYMNKKNRCTVWRF